MMTMQEFYARARRRLDDRSAMATVKDMAYCEVECSFCRNSSGLESMVFKLTDLENPEGYKIIQGRSPEMCLAVWDTVQLTCGISGAGPEMDPMPHIDDEELRKPTHLGNGEVQ